MPKYNLAELTRRAKNPKRKTIPIRDIRVPVMFATDLYLGAYKPIYDLWAAAVPDILAEYQRTISEQTTDSPADIDARVQAAESQARFLSIGISPFLERWALRVESWHRGKWAAAVLSATSVDVSQIIGPQDARQTLEAAISYNAALVKDVSAEAQRRISSIVFDGLRGNKPAREVAKELRGAVGLARARSIRISSDQLSKIAATLADERRREAGLEIWQWLHSGKLRPRLNHVARDGNYYSDNPADVGKVVEGKTVKPLPDSRPGQEPFCGCRSQGVLTFD
jgi:uncharacterized protein with gpF-like domain